MLDLKIIQIVQSDPTSSLILVEALVRMLFLASAIKGSTNFTNTQFCPLANTEDRLKIVVAAKYIIVLYFAKGFCGKYPKQKC